MPPADSGDVDEDDEVFRAFAEVSRPGLLLILAPRRPERFEAVAEKLKRAGVNFVRRTKFGRSSASRRAAAGFDRRSGGAF